MLIQSDVCPDHIGNKEVPKSSCRYPNKKIPKRMNLVYLPESLEYLPETAAGNGISISLT